MVQAEKKILQSTSQSPAPLVPDLKGVSVTVIPDHGLMIVKHPAARPAQKQNTELTPSGSRRKGA
jgi:hypothetical protein